MRQNLPPFGALSGDRNRLQVPRAVDSIQRSATTQDVVDITDDDEPLQQAPSKGELDGLAAFLAARIRTKAELKQVSLLASLLYTNSNRSMEDW